MKTRPFVATIGAVALSLLSAVEAHASETGARSQSKARPAERSNTRLAATGIPDAVLLAAATAARKDSDPELNGSIQETWQAVSAVAQR
ncbi:hypothetical protein [Rubrivivax rivuli]|uniref:Uncharacterized protein n=1 Tax=Rubrivivax rivuli TaxID=1862385 RepID=A0A437R9A3_9BURK|nr:hypothetical protein [Rubrivivax rivuli]RVU43376.1 hypothetical protein EOE66_20760 [Rubrivivax rivuli]